MPHLPARAAKPALDLERDDERVSVKVQGPFATNNSESLRDAVLAGLGVALLPDFSARKRLAGAGSGAAAGMAAGGCVCGKSVRHSPLHAARIAGGRDVQPLSEGDLQLIFSSCCASASRKRGSKSAPSETSSARSRFYRRGIRARCQAGLRNHWPPGEPPPGRHPAIPPRAREPHGLDLPPLVASTGPCRLFSHLLALAAGQIIATIAK